MAQQQLKRVLGRSFGIAATIGTIIGLGILRTPGEIALTEPPPSGPTTVFLWPKRKWGL
ncbi:MAG TPA: hypothetical protein VK827_00070 [Lysobacter sp.]|nr:hypothetical protein [Lysobacter sp.]